MKSLNKLQVICIKSKENLFIFFHRFNYNKHLLDQLNSQLSTFIVSNFNREVVRKKHICVFIKYNSHLCKKI